MQGRTSASACMNRLKESRDAGKVWRTPDSTTNSNGPLKVSNLHTKVICRVAPSTQLRQSELAQIKCNLCNESVFISSKDSHRLQRRHRAIQTLHYGAAYILEEKVIIIVFIVILFGVIQQKATALQHCKPSAPVKPCALQSHRFYTVE